VLIAIMTPLVISIALTAVLVGVYHLDVSMASTLIHHYGRCL